MMANSSVDVIQPIEHKCDEAEEPSSPTSTDKGEPSRKSIGENVMNSIHHVDKKFTLLFHATGNAPILKKRRIIVEPTRKVADVSSFLRRFMKLNAAESLFLYVNQAFSPGLDRTIGNLFECFGVEGVLNVHYCTSQAWG